MRLVVTVGMSRYPFDRLLAGVAPVCREHQVFAQTGASRLSLPCESKPFVPYPELVELLATADVVVCHAGNVVRLIERLPKIPIVAARSSAFGEAANDHQVEFLRREAARNAVVPLWDTDELAELVNAHAPLERQLLRTRDLPAPTPSHIVAETLDALLTSLDTKRTLSPARSQHGSRRTDPSTRAVTPVEPRGDAQNRPLRISYARLAQQIRRQQ
jgi:UDP-N-acetylglucosamine transferase subunit ALG13